MRQMWAHSNVGSLKCGLTQMWAHTNVGSHKCGLTQMWAHSNVGSHKCGLTQMCAHSNVHNDINLGHHCTVHSWLTIQTCILTAISNSVFSGCTVFVKTPIKVLEEASTSPPGGMKYTLQYNYLIKSGHTDSGCTNANDRQY